MTRPATKSVALWVLRRLRAAGFQSLFAGGCVRDMLLGIRSSDYDVATDARPEQVKRLFGHVLLIGAKFGVAMIIHKGRKLEVTTFRSDLSYSDGRHPDAVRFSSARQDALRRDFTINGMFYDPLAEKLIDYVGGRDDLARHVIRTIGSPARRFAEDYLRMIRAARFAVRLDFSLAPATAAAIRKHSPRITSISGERIFEELSRMLSRDSAGGALRLLSELHLVRSMIPEMFEDDGLFPAGLERVDALAGRKDFPLTLAALLVELPAKKIRKIIRRWGASNELRDALCFLAENLSGWETAAEMPLCGFKRLLGHRQFRRLMLLWAVQERRATGRAVQARRIASRAAGIPKNKIAPPPLLTGVDLIAMGITEGPRLGRTLQALYDEQLDEKISTRREAMKTARASIKSPGRH